MDGAIGINSVLGTYYEALFNNDQATADEFADVLRKNEYVSLIEETLK